MTDPGFVIRPPVNLTSRMSPSSQETPLQFDLNVAEEIRWTWILLVHQTSATPPISATSKLHSLLNLRYEPNSTTFLMLSFGLLQIQHEATTEAFEGTAVSCLLDIRILFLKAQHLSEHPMQSHLTWRTHNPTPLRLKPLELPMFLLVARQPFALPQTPSVLFESMSVDFQSRIPMEKLG